MNKRRSGILADRGDRLAWLAGAWAVALVLAAGCGNPRGTVPVEGRVTFGGQPPPNSGFVYFVPSGGEPSAAGRRPGTGLFAKDGAFKATSFEDGDGLIPGTYEVRVTCEMPVVSSAKGSHSSVPKSVVPEAFKPADVTVPSDGPRPFRVEIDVR
jgi:hypothetical protein